MTRLHPDMMFFTSVTRLYVLPLKEKKALDWRCWCGHYQIQLLCHDFNFDSGFDKWRKESNRRSANDARARSTAFTQIYSWVTFLLEMAYSWGRVERFGCNGLAQGLNGCLADLERSDQSINSLTPRYYMKVNLIMVPSCECSVTSGSTIFLSGERLTEIVL